MQMRALFFLAFSACAVVQGAGAVSTGLITTVAGGGVAARPAVEAKLTAPRKVAVDAAGNFYFSDASRIWKVDTTGTLRVHAGTGQAGFSGDGGPATAAQLSGPSSMIVDATGNLLLADGHRVRKIDSQGVISTIVGNGIAGFSGDNGPALSASLNAPVGMAFDDSGHLLIVDSENKRVRKVAAGTITTVAGGGTLGDGGPAVGASLASPRGIVSDGAGGFYIAEITLPPSLRHVNAGGVISTRLLSAGFPLMLARDSAGTIYFTQWGFGIGILTLRPDGNITPLGASAIGFSGDGGPVALAAMQGTDSVAVSPAGEIFIADTGNARIRKVSTNGIINTVAGGGMGLMPCLAGIAASDLVFYPGAIVTDPAGNVYVADSANGCVFRIDVSGSVTMIVAKGVLNGPAGMALDSAGNLYVAEASAHRVIRVDTAGNITRVAGGGTRTSTLGDGGPASEAALSYPSDVALDAAGNLYIADSENRRVRMVDSSGSIRTIAGSSTEFPYYAGDGGPATQARLRPLGLAVDRDGNLFIADDHLRIRKVDTRGLISTVAGNGIGIVADGETITDGVPATSANIVPERVTVDAQGNIYISEPWRNRLRIVAPDGIIRTLAGTGSQASSGDNGPPEAASLNSPRALHWDVGRQSLLVGEAGRVRRIVVADVIPDAFAFAPQIGVPIATVVQSDTVTLSGFDSTTAISVTAGEYSIGCNGVFTAVAGSIDPPGQTVCVRHTSANVANKDSVTTLTIGPRQATFSSTTLPGPGATTTSTPSLDFGGQSMLMTTIGVTLTVANTGTVPVTINAVRTAGDFAAAHACGTLAPSETCAVAVTFTPLAVGTRAGTLTVQASSGTQVVVLSGVGERSLTTHYYRSILRREPDGEGKGFWDGEALRVTQRGANLNETWFALATGFFFSAEYAILARSDAEFLTDMYRTFFNRAPDAGGLQFWLDQMAAGVPRESVLASFTFSPEFVAFTGRIFGDTTARAEIDLLMDLYRGIHSRLPDNGGIDFWVARIRAAQCASPPSTRAAAIRAEVDSISSQFLNSPEYLARNRTNAQYVADLYNAFHRRGADTPGLQFWVNKLATGAYSREIVRTGFLLSQEFQQRVNRVIAQGCLQ